MTTQVYQSQAVEQIGLAFAPEPIESAVTIALLGGFAFDRQVIAESGVICAARKVKLTRYRNLFGLIVLFLIVLAISFPFFGLRYEPVIAVLLSVLGTFIVFMLKVADSE
jgi:Ca2+/Na+ antiporter